MRILTIDTTLNKMYISLGGDDFFDSKIVESDEKKYHSAYLMSTIAKMLLRHRLTLHDVDVIATNNGPGSFTGIRVGMTTARVIAQSVDAKVVGVSSMEILSGMNDTSKPSLVIMDARKNKAYVGVFSEDSIMQPSLLDMDEALIMASQDKYYVISDARLAGKIDGAINFEEQDFDFGKVLFDIAQKRMQVSKISDDELAWAKLKPLYIQPPPISTPKK